MKVAIDKSSIQVMKQKSNNEYIYIFDNEGLKDLLKLKIRCIHKNELDDIEVDLNLTDYNIICEKKAKITDDDLWKMPKVKDNRFAIIVPNYNNDHGNYNGKTYLQNCIESVLNQTYRNFDLIIVDDMSTDTSVETVEKYREEYFNKIHLVENNRKRYNGGSRNVGIDYALDYLDFDYFCFLDSDDWWKDENVLETINKNLKNCELMLIGLECINEKGVFIKKIHEYKNYEDFFLSDNKVWCTAWARVIRKDKIVYFCEDTLMEDRVWSYKQADNVDLDKVVNLRKILYVWNRLNTSNSVSLSRSGFWNASAYCHIGHQLQLLENIKHKEMIPILKERIEMCKRKLNNNIYQQY